MDNNGYNHGKWWLPSGKRLQLANWKITIFQFGKSTNFLWPLPRTVTVITRGSPPAKSCATDRVEWVPPKSHLVGGFLPYPSEKWWTNRQLGYVGMIFHSQLNGTIKFHGLKPPPTSQKLVGWWDSQWLWSPTSWVSQGKSPSNPQWFLWLMALVFPKSDVATPSSHPCDFQIFSDFPYNQPSSDLLGYPYRKPPATTISLNPHSPFNYHEIVLSHG